VYNLLHKKRPLRHTWRFLHNPIRRKTKHLFAMEPISTATAIVGLITSCTKLASFVQNFICLADEKLRVLEQETRSLSNVLRSMKASLSDSLIRQAAMNSHTTRHWSDVNRSLLDCEDTLKRLKTVAEKARVPQAGLGIFRTARRTFKLALSSVEILMYRQQLSTCSQTRSSHCN
jgi:uncharacterized protein YigA (DUF484 family)